jgi:hypothetical protein
LAAVAKVRTVNYKKRHMNKMMNKISDKLYSARGETSSSEHFIEKREEQKVLVKGKKIILPFIYSALYFPRSNL